MNILIIDTCLGSLSVALAVSSKLVKEITITENNQQSKLLASTVREILSSCKMQVTDIDTIIATNGPGSFTGIRIGLSFALGLQAMNQCDSYACSTLATLNADYKGKVLSTIRAGSDTYYVQTFLNHDAIGDIKVMTKAELDEISDYKIIGHYKDPNLLPNTSVILKLFNDPNTKNKIFNDKIEPLYVKAPYF